MCRILAIIGQPSDADTRQIMDFFQDLAERGKVPLTISSGHKDGWGLLAYKNGKQVVYKRGLSSAITDVDYKKAVEDAVINKFDILISHLRKGTVGKISIENCHPFVFENFSFCQNGTVYKSDLIPLNDKYKKLLKGETDSEKIFLFILQKYFETTSNIKVAVELAVKEIRKNFDYTGMNIIFSDGKRILVMRDANKKYEKYKELGLMNYYALYLGLNKKENYKIISSEKIKIQGVDWRIFKNREVFLA